MDQPTASLTVATPDTTRFGHPINFGIAVLAFDLKGLADAPSLDIKTKLLAGDHNVFAPDNLPKPAAPAIDLGTDNGAPVDPMKEYLAGIRKLDKAALQEQCRKVGLPEEVWGKMGKASLVDYLEKASTEEPGDGDEDNTDKGTSADDETKTGDDDKTE